MARRKLTVEEIRRRIEEEWSSNDSGSDDEREDSISDEEVSISCDEESDEEAEESDVSFSVVGPQGDDDRESDVSYGADGTMWRRLISARIGRAAARDIFRGRPGPKPAIVRSPYDA